MLCKKKMSSKEKTEKKKKMYVTGKGKKLYLYKRYKVNWTIEIKAACTRKFFDMYVYNIRN